MATKPWRLVVTELGSDGPIADVVLEADNWMAALRAGRATMGENGGVPTGSSCAVAPNGRVTIHDPVTRRTYALTPSTEAELRASEPPARYEPSSAKRAAAAVSGSAAVTSAASGQTAPAVGAHAAAQPSRSNSAVSSPSKAAASRPATTSASSHRPSHGASGVAGTTESNAGPAAAAGPVPGAGPQATGRRRPASKTIGYAVPSPVVGTPPPSEAKRAGSDGIAPRQPLAAAPATPAQAPRSTWSTSEHEATPTAPANDLQWRLLASRDQEPSEENPLRYRERTFVVPPETSKEDAEWVLRARLAELREQLSDAPPGQYINLAVFDHRWDRKPQRPPIATLQWKDWRGEPAIDFPLERRSQRPPPAPSHIPMPNQAALTAASLAPQSAAAAQGLEAPLPAPKPPAEPVAVARAPIDPPPPQHPAAEPPVPSGPIAAVEAPRPPPAPPVAAQTPSVPVVPSPSSSIAASASSADLVGAAAAEPAAAPIVAPAPEVEAAATMPLSTAPTAADTGATQPDRVFSAPSIEPVGAPANAAPVGGAESPRAETAQRTPISRGHGRTITDEHDARLAQAFEACQDLLFLHTPVEALEFVVRLLDELMPSEATTACLYDINTDEFRFVVVRGPGSEHRQGQAVHASSGLFGAAAQFGAVPLRIDDGVEDERYEPLADGRPGLESASMLYMPLIHQRRLLGILQLINSQRDLVYTVHDGDLIAYVGQQLAEFLHKARIAPDKRAEG